jgi:hypothetical protein
MAIDILVLGSVSSLVFCITLPAFFIGFVCFGNVINSALNIYFKCTLPEIRQSHKIASILLGVGTFMITVRFVFEAIWTGFLDTLVQKMVVDNSNGFVWWFFFATLFTEILCIFAIIKVIHMRRADDWDLLHTQSLVPPPE